MTSENEREKQRRATIQSLFRGLPSGDFDAYQNELKSIVAIFFAEMATELEPVFNAELEKRPHEELSEMRSLTSWANQFLRDLHLAITCPKTGNPATLFVDWVNIENDRGRFRLQTRDEKGKPLKSLTSLQLPKFKLREYHSHQFGTRRYEGPSARER